MLDNPRDIAALTKELAEIQQTIHEAGVPEDVPGLVDRLDLMLSSSQELDASERIDAADLLDAQPAGAALLHGDLHPGNVLLGAKGPVVIDWFDAAIGHPAADIARTLLLLRSEATDLRHLPAATPQVVSTVRQHFLGAVESRVDANEIHTWCRLRAAGRLGEQTDLDVTGLLGIWRSESLDSGADHE